MNSLSSTHFYKERKYPVRYLQNSLIDGTLYHKISIEKAPRDIQYYYINVENHFLEIIEEYSEEARVDGISFKTTFPEYQQLENIWFPKKMLLYGNDRLLVEDDITKVILNPKFSKKDFRIKAKK